MYDIKIYKNGNIKLIKNTYNKCNYCNESIKEINNKKVIILNPSYLGGTEGSLEGYHLNIITKKQYDNIPWKMIIQD